MPRPSSTRITGRLQAHRDGYAFVIPSQPLDQIQGDIFIPPDAVRNAMHGDRVMARIKKLNPDGRAEGEIARILDRANQ
ncbi:MAG: hypothetical protein GY953_39560, partial [bacterium]|nr:hypothetical protein [bacterium]